MPRRTTASEPPSVNTVLKCHGEPTIHDKVLRGSSKTFINTSGKRWSVSASDATSVTRIEIPGGSQAKLKTTGAGDIEWGEITEIPEMILTSTYTKDGETYSTKRPLFDGAVELVNPSHNCEAVIEINSKESVLSSHGLSARRAIRFKIDQGDVYPLKEDEPVSGSSNPSQLRLSVFNVTETYH